MPVKGCECDKKFYHLFSPPQKGAKHFPDFQQNRRVCQCGVMAEVSEEWAIEIGGERGFNYQCGYLGAFVFCEHPDRVAELKGDEHLLCTKAGCPVAMWRQEQQ